MPILQYHFPTEDVGLSEFGASPPVVADPEASALEVCSSLVEELCGLLFRMTTNDFSGIGVVSTGSSSRTVAPPSLCRRLFRI